MKNIIWAIILIIAIIMATNFFKFGESQAGQYPSTLDFRAAVEQILGDILTDKFLDKAWERVRITTVFESLDGYTKAGNVPTIDSSGVNLLTAASLNSTSELSKTPISLYVLKAAPNSRMRLSVTFNTGALSNSESHFVVGAYGAGNNYFGFETLNSALKGSVSKNGGSKSTVELGTISTGQYYDLEAIMDKGNKVIFLVDGVEKGVISDNVPDTNDIFSSLLEFYLKTTNASAKSASVSFFDYIQESKR